MTSSLVDLFLLSIIILPRCDRNKDSYHLQPLDETRATQERSHGKSRDLSREHAELKTERSLSVVLCLSSSEFDPKIGEMLFECISHCTLAFVHNGPN